MSEKHSTRGMKLTEKQMQTLRKHATKHKGGMQSKAYEEYDEVYETRSLFYSGTRKDKKA